MTSAAPLLELRSIVTRLRVGEELRPVLRDVSLQLDRGEVLGIVGESGSGKSMIARTILRTLPPGAQTSGQVLLDGRDLLSVSKRELRAVRRERVAMIFQDPRAFINPLWKAGDYVAETLRLHRRLSRRDARRRMLELLEDVGIREADRVARSYPHQLSGGMLQRVGIAGALTTDPDLLIADEPTTALDVTVQADIVALLQELAHDRGMATIFITHDLDLAAMICRRILVLYAGATMVEQESSDLLRAPAHPYAQALLAARPRVDARLERLQAVTGKPASALDPPPGCPFHPRCAFAVERCTEATVRPVALREGVRSSCIRIHDVELVDAMERRVFVR